MEIIYRSKSDSTDYVPDYKIWGGGTTDGALQFSQSHYEDRRRRLAKARMVKRFFTLISILSVAAILTCFFLSVFNVVHWAIWLPPIMAWVGVLVSGLMLKAQLEKAITAYESQNRSEDANV